MKILGLLVAAVTLAALSSMAGPAVAGPSPAVKVVSEAAFAPADVRRFVLRSHRLGREVAVVVTAPPSTAFVLPGRKLPAIYALDGGWGVAGPVAQMMGGVWQMAPAYLVAVDTLGADRNRNLLYRPVVRNGETSGGDGVAFRAFLSQELRPFLEARYPLDPAQAILFGHSFGGIFAANALADAPEAFSAYVIASPSVWADGEVLARLQQAASRGGGRRVFVSVGEAEPAAMLEGATQVAAALSGPGSTFKVEKRVFPGDHIGYYPVLAPTVFGSLLPARLPAGSGPRFKPIALPAEALEPLAGVYAMRGGRTVTIVRREGALFFLPFDANTTIQIPLLPHAPLEFFIPGFDFHFAFEAAPAGPAGALVMRYGGGEGRFTRVARSGR